MRLTAVPLRDASGEVVGSLAACAQRASDIQIALRLFVPPIGFEDQRVRDPPQVPLRPAVLDEPKLRFGILTSEVSRNSPNGCYFSIVRGIGGRLTENPQSFGRALVFNQEKRLLTKDRCVRLEHGKLSAHSFSFFRFAVVEQEAEIPNFGVSVIGIVLYGSFDARAVPGLLLFRRETQEIHEAGRMRQGRVGAPQIAIATEYGGRFLLMACFG